MNHGDLVEIARQWLIGRGCAVVMTEMPGCDEIPDAIGWKGAQSLLIECKTSIADFQRDAEKAFRRFPETGLGMRRYFMVPRSIAKRVSQELENVDWGVIEAGEERVKIIKQSAEHRTDGRAEIYVLLSAIRRVAKHAPRGICVRYYEIESKVNRATLGVQL